MDPAMLLTDSRNPSASRRRRGRRIYRSVCMCVGGLYRAGLSLTLFSLLSRLSRLAASTSSSPSQLSRLCGGSCSAGRLIQALISISFTSGQLLLLSYIKVQMMTPECVTYRLARHFKLKTVSCCCVNDSLLTSNPTRKLKLFSVLI